jgi:diguanylate cyclase (GGDEF)-like protein
MQQKDIDFRELLERVLPLDELPPADRLHVQRALRSGIAEHVEQAALHALAQLERHGAVRRIASPPNGSGPVLRYQPRAGIDIISIHAPAPRKRDELIFYPRASLPAQAHTTLHQVRRLLRLDEPLFMAEPGVVDAHGALIDQLDQAGRELLGASELRFISAHPRAEAPDPLDADLARETMAEPGLVMSCSDTARSPKLRAAAARAGVRSLVLSSVAAAEGESLGVLEVRHPEPNAFGIEQLALVAFIADTCANALERAARIEKLVFIDPLTSAYNRSYFDLQVRNEMARAQRESASIAMCIVDIDDFKSFNTMFGYEAGNQVLVQVAQALRSEVRPFDTVARWGGEEFAVLLTAPVLEQDVRTISERLRNAVERQVVRIDALDGTTHRVVVTVSIGVAMYPEHQSTAADLWRAANQALLIAKRPPKNQVVFYSAEGA